MPRHKGQVESGRAEQHRLRLRTPRSRLLALQTRLDETVAELKDHEQAIAGLEEWVARYRAGRDELEHRLATLEAKYETVLDELRTNRQRHQEQLSRLKHSVEAHRQAANELDQILDADDH
jgi:chromosome segregation ATPase